MKIAVIEAYLSCREAPHCAMCRHEMSAKELRKERRHICVFSLKPFCRLMQRRGMPQPQEWGDRCAAFERIDELRGKNMSCLQKLYFNMYTKKFIAKAIAPRKEWKQLPYERLARLIANYEKRARKSNIANTIYPHCW